MIDAAYNAWADETLLAYLRTLDVRPPKVDLVLAHLAAAGETWLARLDGTAPPPDLWPERPFEESAARIAAVDARLMNSPLLSGGEGPGVRGEAEKIVRYRTFAGVEQTNTVDEILTHALNHATYHRGEVAGLLLAAGLEPPLTDYIVYLRRS